MLRLRERIDELNRDVLTQRGLNLRVVYDETNYISSAINLVQQNIWVGGLLALGILTLFLRSILPTIIVFAAIPVSVVGTFVAIAGLGFFVDQRHFTCGIGLCGWDVVVDGIHCVTGEHIPVAPAWFNFRPGGVSWCAPGVGTHSRVSAHDSHCVHSSAAVGIACGAAVP